MTINLSAEPATEPVEGLRRTMTGIKGIVGQPLDPLACELGLFSLCKRLILWYKKN